MNLFETLKQLKEITADPAFTEKSKRAVLAQAPRESWRLGKAVVRIFETGIAVALAGFFILIITGQFPSSKYLSPVPFSVIDPQGLRAEAQAIDIQIQLTNLTYQEASTTQSTIQIASKPKNVMSLTLMSSTVSDSNTPTQDGSAQSSTLSIDEALQTLSN